MWSFVEKALRSPIYLHMYKKKKGVFFHVPFKPDEVQLEVPWSLD